MGLDSKRREIDCELSFFGCLAHGLWLDEGLLVNDAAGEEKSSGAEGSLGRDGT